MKKPNIKMCDCTTSSQVSAHGHCPDTNTLAVTFRNGGTYHYEGVPTDVYNKFCASESFGKFLGANVKGRFKHSKQDS